MNGEGRALIQIEAYLNKQKRYFSTKVYVKPNQWDNSRRMIKNHPNKDALNQYLCECIDELERKELEMLRKGKGVILQDLSKPKELSSPSFLDFLQYEIMHSHLKASTMKNHYSTLRILSQYRDDVGFGDLDFSFLSGFEYFLLQKKYHSNTIAKHMKHLKRYINLAINKGLMELQQYPFRKYKIKYVDSKRTHLTPEELHRLETIDLSTKPRLKKCLDMFLFSCYTGLRFSDVIRVTPGNILSIDGKWWLIYSSLKTDVSVRLPLFLLFDGKALPIIERYRFNQPTIFKMKPNSNSNVNKQLALICRLASIDKKVSFHTARHTNATLLLYLGANITTVQKLLGHKSVRTTEIYSNIMDMTVVRDLENLNIK